MMEKVWIWLSWRMPKQLAKWTFIRVAVHNESNNPADRTCGDALRAWSPITATVSVRKES